MIKFDSPFILEPLKAAKIESKRYSYIEPSIECISEKDIALEVVTSSKKRYIYLKKDTPRVKNEMKEIDYNVTKITNKYNGYIVPKNARYALYVKRGEWEKTIFIFKTGAMTNDILGINGLPKEVLKTKEEFNQFLEKWLNPYEIKYYLSDLKEDGIILNMSQ